VVRVAGGNEVMAHQRKRGAVRGEEPLESCERVDHFRTCVGGSRIDTKKPSAFTGGEAENEEGGLWSKRFGRRSSGWERCGFLVPTPRPAEYAHPPFLNPSRRARLDRRRDKLCQSGVIRMRRAAP
jgi:hypothetical protein